jgi:hypothetical protein
VHAQVAVRDDLIIRVAVVDSRLEDIHPLARDHGAAQAPDQLFALPENIGPQITSIQPTLPVKMSIRIVQNTSG